MRTELTMEELDMVNGGGIIDFMIYVKKLKKYIDDKITNWMYS